MTRQKSLILEMRRLLREQDDSPHADQVPGGRADNRSPYDFDAYQLALGAAVEMEHTKDPKLAVEIAMDHLAEIPDYYDRLIDMEADAEGGD